MNMTADERATAHRLILATTLNGFVSSVGAVQDIIAKKALGASDWQIALLAVVWPISNFFSIWWGKYLERTENKSPYYYVVAVFSRLILLLALWVTGFWHLFFLLVVFYSFNSLFIPLQNSMLQGAFRPIVRGRVFGWMTSIATLIIMAVSFFGGRLLDVHEWAFRPMFAVFGVIGFLGTSSLAFIKYKPVRPALREPLSLHLLFVAPIQRARHLMRTNRGFANFEMGFFVYGLGILSITPALPHFLVTDLGMDYTQSFLAKGVIGQLGILLLSPLAGKLHDKRTPAQYTAVVFAMLMLYPMLLIAGSFGGSWAYGLVFLGFACSGVAMAGVNISWNLGSIYYAGDEDASMYQSVHITLTGVRGVLVPFIGYTLLHWFGPRAVFINSTLCFAVAAWINWRQWKNERR